MSHHPTLYDAGIHGTWINCSCNWKSIIWPSVIGAHYEFCEHLATVRSEQHRNHVNVSVFQYLKEKGMV